MSGIDLSLIPPPAVVEPLDFEEILAGHKSRLLDLMPAEQRDDMAATLALESEPIVKLLEEMSYAELVMRSRINHAARAVMLASATGSDLDGLGALYNAQRLLISPGNPDAQPPTQPIYEEDSRFRMRIQLAIDGLSTAGPAAAYRFHALSAAATVKDVAIDSPTPGQVRVTVLATENDGAPAAELLTAVAAALNAEDVRPLTDQVVVEAATVSQYAIEAQLVMYPGPAPEPVLAEAIAAAEIYANDTHRLGYDIVRTGLYAALHRPGVQRVVLISPAEDIARGPRDAAWCSGIAVTVAGTTDV